eukprot:766555-Hanusia_phi.AAC.13
MSVESTNETSRESKGQKDTKLLWENFDKAEFVARELIRQKDKIFIGTAQGQSVNRTSYFSRFRASLENCGLTLFFLQEDGTSVDGAEMASTNSYTWYTGYGARNSVEMLNFRVEEVLNKDETYDFNFLLTISFKCIMPENVVDMLLVDLSYFMKIF